MGKMWFLFPIAFASDFACVDLTPNVTDDDCAKLDITLQYFDQNENCTEALLKEKFDSLDVSYAALSGYSFTAIWQQKKEEVWLTARNEAERNYVGSDDVVTRVKAITLATKAKLTMLHRKLDDDLKLSLQRIGKNHENQMRVIDDTVGKLSRAQNALHNLSTTMRGFNELHNIYITLRARSNRVHLCNAELRRVNEKLMLGGAKNDDEQVLEDCKNLLGEDLIQKLLKTGNTFCSSAEATRRLRLLSTEDVPMIDRGGYLTMAECLEEANYPNFRTGRTYENEDAHRLQQESFVFIDEKIHEECTTFGHYVNMYINLQTAKLLEDGSKSIVEALKNVDRQSSYIAEATETCGANLQSLHGKFKAHAELFAKGQACGRKMTIRWAKDVGKCVESNKWKSVWIPWYNLSNLLGENSNCVQTHNIIVGCMVTAFATVVTVLCLISCIWSARNCSCCCFGRAKPHRSRRRKYVSDSDDTDDSSDEEHDRRKHSLKSRKKKGNKSDRDNKKAKKQKGGKKDEKGEKKAKKGKKNKKDGEDHKKAKSEKKNNAESVRDDSRKGRRENDRSPEDEMQVQWWLSGEHARSMSPADCERGLRLPRDVQIVLQPRKDPQVVHEPPTNAQVRYEPRQNAQVLYEPPTNAQVLREPRQNAQVLREPRKDTQIRYEPRQNAQRLPEPAQKTEALPESLKEVDVLRKP